MPHGNFCGCLKESAHLSPRRTARSQPISGSIKDGRELAPEELPVQLAAATGRDVRDFALTIMFNDGTARDLFGDAVPLFDESGNVRGAVGAFMDTTERNRAQEALIEARQAAEAANQSKDRFLAVLSHELRSPLTPMLMAAAALEHDSDLRPDVREHLAMIKRNIAARNQTHRRLARS